MFKFLVVLLGIGLGLALMLLVVRIWSRVSPEKEFPIFWLGAGYMGFAVAGGFLFFILRNNIVKAWILRYSVMERFFERMPVYQLVSSVVGLIAGLIVAALLCRLFNFLGNGLLTTVLATILYLMLGSLGFSVGRKKSADVPGMMNRLDGFRDRHRKNSGNHAVTSAGKLLDTSAIIDGRILEISRTGFVEGELVVPQFVVDELRHVADSSDESKRERGRRGLDMLQIMQAELANRIRLDETDFEDVTDVDVKLLRLARRTGATVITGDYNLNKAASVNEVKVLNVNELANALRPTVIQGQEMKVRITREGREAGQGLAYLNDGTMVVIEAGKSFVGEEKNITVTSVLQTSAGRMIFAKLS